MRLRLPLRLRFRETPWDIALVIVYTLAVSGVLLLANIGNLLGLLLVLFAPGYVLVAVLFPRGDVIDWIERIVLSFGTSVVVVALLGLVLAVSPIGISYRSETVSVLGFTVLVGIAAYERRVRLPVEKRLEATLTIERPRWKDEGTVDRVVTLAIAASIVAAAGAFAYAVLTPPAGERFTEFYLLGPGGNATGYPDHLTVSELAKISIGLVNHEEKTVNYSVRIDLVGIQIVHNATSGYNETVELNRTTMTWFYATVANGGSWAQPFTFAIGAPGTWEIEFILYKNGIQSTTAARLILHVT